MANYLHLTHTHIYIYMFIENVTVSYNCEDNKIIDMREKFIRWFTYLNAWISQNFEVPNFI